MEAHYTELAQEIHASAPADQPVVHMRSDILAEDGDMMEQSAAGTYHDASGYMQVIMIYSRVSKHYIFALIRLH